MRPHLVRVTEVLFAGSTSLVWFLLQERKRLSVLTPSAEQCTGLNWFCNALLRNYCLFADGQILHHFPLPLLWWVCLLTHLWVWLRHSPIGAELCVLNLRIYDLKPFTSGWKKRLNGYVEALVKCLNFKWSTVVEINLHTHSFSNSMKLWREIVHRCLSKTVNIFITKWKSWPASCIFVESGGGRIC